VLTTIQVKYSVLDQKVWRQMSGHDPTSRTIRPVATGVSGLVKVVVYAKAVTGGVEGLTKRNSGYMIIYSIKYVGWYTSYQEISIHA